MSHNSVYIVENSGEVFKQKLTYKLASGGKRNLSTCRCLTCFILFQCHKLYPRKTCALCIYEKGGPLLKKKEESTKSFYDKIMRISRQLQLNKDRINEALKCRTINSVKVLRDDKGVFISN